MKAKDARKLKVGDFVTALFGGSGYKKTCEIIAIDWPTFTLRTKDHKGREMIRTRRYVSLWSRSEPNAPPSVTTPFWLEWPSEANNDTSRGEQCDQK